MLGKKLRTGRLLQRGASFAEKEQSDTGPDAVALGPACGNCWMDRGRAACVAADVPTSIGREKKLERSPVILCILHFGLKTANVLLRNGNIFLR